MPPLRWIAGSQGYTSSRSPYKDVIAHANDVRRESLVFQPLPGGDGIAFAGAARHPRVGENLWTTTCHTSWYRSR